MSYVSQFFSNPEEKMKKYIYRWLASLRVIVGMHVFYVYASSQWDQSSKWGTFVEATTDQISYLPYTTIDDNNKLYQNLLFEPCVIPVFSGTNIEYQNNLCEINTTNYETFSVTVPPNFGRSDGEPVTIEDVFFTYSNILQENRRDLERLTTYQNVNIQVDGTQLKITFPSASIDNMIFFTNFVLPEHILANRDVEFYTTNFATNPIVSWCGSVQTWENDSTSAVFDVSWCEEMNIKFFQVKYFDKNEKLQEYVNSDGKNLDVILGSDPLAWFEQVKYIVNKYSTIFFNTESSMSKEMRADLANLILNISQSYEWLISDNFLFDINIQDPDIVDIRQQVIARTSTNNDDQELTQLPKTITLPEDNASTYEITTAISERRSIQIEVETEYDSLSINHNGWWEYFPQSRSGTAAQYNMSPTLRNIQRWKNTYSIQWYIDDKVIDIFEFVIWYIDTPEPAVVDIEDNDSIALTLLYFENELNTSIVKEISDYLGTNNISNIIDFQSFSDIDKLEWTIESGAYDMVLRTVNLWLRKDISNIFSSQSSFINPSRYTNEQMASLVNEYFRVSQAEQIKIKEKIDRLYSSQTPFVILGKQFESYQINPKLEQAPFPQRLYVFGWRKEYLNTIEWFGHVTLERNKIWNWKNFSDFIKNI